MVRPGDARRSHTERCELSLPPAAAAAVDCAGTGRTECRHRPSHHTFSIRRATSCHLLLLSDALRARRLDGVSHRSATSQLRFSVASGPCLPCCHVAAEDGEEGRQRRSASSRCGPGAREIHTRLHSHSHAFHCTALTRLRYSPEFHTPLLQPHHLATYIHMVACHRLLRHFHVCDGQRM